MDHELIPIMGILASLVALPGLILFFIYKMRQSKDEVKKLIYKKEIMALEVRQQEMKLQALQEENKLFDRKLSDSIGQD